MIPSLEDSQILHTTRKLPTRHLRCDAYAIHGMLLLTQPHVRLSALL